MSRVERLKELFDAAVAQPPAARDAFLERACGTDAALRAELEALIACDAGTLAPSAADPLAARVAAAAAAQFDATAPWLGRRIGNYRIVGELGQGGMGSVYLAERADREYQARVAIKLIRGFPTQAALERLRRERQVLAGLVHPNIARLLDGGTTPEGQPYLVMEYVEGRPLMQWWAERRPPLALRLRLFQQLCLAVHHAHQNLIVHRDLKPGNVLVRADDTPVLLDFGIAKLIAPEADGERATELRAFTPDYASPEQVSGGPVTTASDVYALGLILYELLCGKPYKSGGRTTSWRASRPARVAEAADAPWLRAEAAAIGGDLEHVVRRALAEEPARRYSSAAALAADIDRHFAGLPLEAGPDRLGYRLAKFVRRHRLGVAAAALALVGIVAAAGWLARERARAVRAERRAETEARTANRVTEFLLQLFRNADPETARGREVSARELLDRGGGELARNALDDAPAVRARLLAALGEIYGDIGLPARSVELLDEAARLTPAAAPLERARVLHLLCKARHDVSDFAAARAACEASLALHEANLPPGHLDIAHAENQLGLVDQAQGRYAEAERRYRAALAVFRAAGEAHRDDAASTTHNLGFLAAQRGDWETARREYAAALAEKRALYGDAHPRTLNSLNGLAQAEQALGDLVAARATFEQVLALRIRVHGADSVPTAHARNDLANVLQDLGDYAEAERQYRAALDLHRRLQPQDSLDAATTANNLATLLEDRGDLVAARGWFEQSLAVRRSKFAAGHPALARAEHNLARCLIELGEIAAARPLLDAARAARRAAPSEDAQRFDSELLAAEWQLANGQVEAAATTLAALTPPDGRGNYRRRARYADAQAHLAAARNDWPAARTAERRALDELRTLLPETHPLCARAELALARYAHAAHDEAAAGDALRRALPVLRAALVERAADRVAAERLAATLKLATE